MRSPEVMGDTLDSTTDEVEAMVEFFISVVESIRYHDQEIDFYTPYPTGVKERICSALYYARISLCPGKKSVVPGEPGGQFGGGGATREF